MTIRKTSHAALSMCLIAFMGLTSCAKSNPSQSKPTINTKEAAAEPVLKEGQKIMVVNGKEIVVETRKPTAQPPNPNHPCAAFIKPQPIKTSPDKCYARIITRSGAVWKRVLCEKDVTDIVVKTIQKVMIDAGDYAGPINGKLDLMTYAGVKKFQIRQDLSTGGLTVETVECMGVDWETLG